MSPRFRNHSLLYFSSLVFLLVAIVLALFIDIQFYQPHKKELMKETGIYPPEVPPNLSIDAARLIRHHIARERLVKPGLTDSRRRQLESYLLEEKAAQELRDAIEAEIQDMIASGLPLLEVRLLLDEEVLAEQSGRPVGYFNHLGNALILRNFRLTAGTGFKDPENLNEVRGELRFVITTPLESANIEALTRRYWLLIAGSWLGLIACYGLLLRFIILPIKKVTEAIQSRTRQPGQFVRRPHTRLETLYNEMARDALLAEMGRGIRAMGDRNLRLTLQELFVYLSRQIRECFHFDQCQLFEFSVGAGDTIVFEGQYPAVPPGETSAWEDLQSVFAGVLARDLRTSFDSQSPRFIALPHPNGRGRIFAGALPHPGHEGQMRVLVLTKRQGASTESMVWHATTAERLYRLVIDQVEHQMLQSRALFREKSEANINLSRNLGHDLTNIIATNKLELMTVGQLLRGDLSKLVESEERVEIVRDTMSRILDNTRSLQEIVNLYRAFEYLKSPKYEEVDINQMLGDIIDIFQMSMTAANDVSFDFPPQMPTFFVEPRLIKLAIFNLLTNAQDAIRRLPPAKQDQARISVQTDCNPDKKELVIRVRDTGPGIRTSDGRLAGKEDIRRIFELGYTTKAGGQGEGLGLNWVRTILTELHPGELRAYNHPEGGAVFEIRLTNQKKRDGTEST